MQTCSRCYTQSPDNIQTCPNCQADLQQFSTTAVALASFNANARVKNVRLIVADDACPACQQMAATYEKGAAPALPVPGCSHEHGCRCFYEPMLDEIYP